MALSNRRKPFFPIVILFILLNAFFIAGRNLLERWNADVDVLIIGNILLFTITLTSIFIARKGLRQNNSYVFLRSVYGSIMLKLFLCIIAAFIYIATFRKDLNKPALFTLMGLYLVYTFIEVSLLTKTLKQNTNA
ncbi:MAG: hypothetical protein ICV51_07915 [Flavisolibacter sp.]|nr:hypothetical protein [Flavisolibacter sp.]MBD0286827.1 hypothetical protein [Flavisolibacter sp.]MBD0296253.1 hypothetical protein [Flavisolibacter sp.]MBD0350681.1 hypothetical protein [Flavisolibacter sp.]MBD0375537.1 hypothetical protein [Flavisolibacter sp.]